MHCKVEVVQKGIEILFPELESESLLRKHNDCLKQTLQKALKH